MIGTVFRIRYELVAEVLRGPIFTAYKARDRVGSRDVCIRVLDPVFAADRPFVAKLEQVAARLSQVQHPALERFYGLEEHDGAPFIVSEWTEGQLLSERIQRLAPFSAPVAIAMCLEVCEGLSALHAANLTHGDIAPGNLLVTPDNRVKLQLGGFWESYSASRFAGPAVLASMSAYLAPEISGGHMPSPASDIYSLGIVLFELLAGRPPFMGDTPLEVAIKHTQAPLPSVRMFNPATPAALEELIKKATAKTAADRYQSGAELAADLKAMQDALRFGRTLSWPISGGAETKPQPVAPKMGTASRKAPARTPEQFEDDGVPRWLSTMVYSGAVVLLAMLAGWLYFYLNQPKLVRVPDVVGLSFNEASMRLSGMGLQLRVSRRESSEKFPEGAVIDLNPPPGQSVRERSHVTSVISSGSKFVEVPELRGQTVSEAKTLLRALNLELDEPVREVVRRDIEPGKIVEQTPEARRKVERNTRIHATVSGRSFSGDDPAGRVSTYRLQIRLPSGDSGVVVRVDITDARDTRTVYEERHEPGDAFVVTAEGYGDEATFRIFYDGELVRQVTKPAVN